MADDNVSLRPFMLRFFLVFLIADAAAALVLSLPNVKLPALPFSIGVAVGSGLFAGYGFLHSYKRLPTRSEKLLMSSYSAVVSTLLFTLWGILLGLYAAGSFSLGIGNALKLVVAFMTEIGALLPLKWFVSMFGQAWGQAVRLLAFLVLQMSLNFALFYFIYHFMLRKEYEGLKERGRI